MLGLGGEEGGASGGGDGSGSGSEDGKREGASEDEVEARAHSSPAEGAWDTLGCTHTAGVEVQRGGVLRVGEWG